MRNVHVVLEGVTRELNQWKVRGVTRPATAVALITTGKNPYRVEAQQYERLLRLIMLLEKASAGLEQVRKSIALLGEDQVTHPEAAIQPPVDFGALELEAARTISALSRDGPSLLAAGKGLIDLWGAHQFWRLRECPYCHRMHRAGWFGAKDKRKKYCSDNCRSAMQQLSGAGRMRQRQYHKRWRREKIQIPNLKAKLERFPKRRSLTKQERRRKELVVARLELYLRDLPELEQKLKRGKSRSRI